MRWLGEPSRRGLALAHTPAAGLPRLLLVLLVAGAALTQPRAAGGVAAGGRVPWQGGSWYLQGANVAWYHWGCDFGCGAGGGVSSPATQAGLAPAFTQAQAAGMHVIRWWMFEGNPTQAAGGGGPQIAVDAGGSPTGINPAVATDVEAALRLADTYDLYYDFVLFSSPTAVPNGWVTNPAQRTALASTLGGLFARFKGSPRILSWEVFNEPEWDIWNNKVPQEAVQATVGAIASSIHANSSAYATVGSANLDGLPLWVGQGLDYYQAHWYDPMSSGTACAACTDYAAVRARYTLDGPLVIGEFSTTTTDASAAARYDYWYSKGYAGAWAWSLFPDQTADKLAIDLAASRSFANQYADVGPRGASAAPAASGSTGTSGAQSTQSQAQGLTAPAPEASSSAGPLSARVSSVDQTATPDVLHPPLPFATAQCGDGWFSYRLQRAGTCAGHDGVLQWITEPGTACALSFSRAQEGRSLVSPACS